MRSIFKFRKSFIWCELGIVHKANHPEHQTIQAGGWEGGGRNGSKRAWLLRLLDSGLDTSVECRQHLKKQLLVSVFARYENNPGESEAASADNTNIGLPAFTWHADQQAYQGRGESLFSLAFGKISELCAKNRLACRLCNLVLSFSVQYKDLHSSDFLLFAYFYSFQHFYKNDQQI